MKKLTMIMSAAVLAISAVSTSGCAVTTAGIKKGDERNFARSLNDASAARAIKARMGRVEGFNLGGVDIEVAQGIVLLSGNVPRPEDKIEAERIAWSAPRIDKVGNEIRLNTNQGQVRNVKDGILNQSVRARLIANKNVKARNFNIEVHDGTVYLMGVARTQDELALAAHTASTTKGAKEVVSYVKVADINGYGLAGGPNNRAPNAVAAAPTYQAPSYNSNGAQDYSAPMPLAAPLPRANPDPVPLDSDALESGEPYYLDPQTGQRVEIPEGVTPIPYVPDTGPGSLGAGGAALPPGVKPSQMLGGDPLTSMPTSLPTDQMLGEFRSGPAGQAVSVIESEPYSLDPNTGEIVPVKWNGGP